jgi:hypothetical protein
LLIDLFDRGDETLFENISERLNFTQRISHFLEDQVYGRDSPLVIILEAGLQLLWRFILALARFFRTVAEFIDHSGERVFL